MASTSKLIIETMNEYTIINNTPVTPILGNTDSILQEKSAICWDGLNEDELEWLYWEEQKKTLIMQEMIEQHGY